MSGLLAHGLPTAQGSFALRSALRLPAPRSGGSATTASADFSLRGGASSRSPPRRPFRRKARPPQVRTMTFPAQPPDLRRLSLGRESFAVQSRRPATDRARPADRPRRPRQFDDIQAGGVPARRPGRHQDALAALHLDRQPLLGGAVQDAQVPARLPPALRVDRTRQDLRPPVLRLVQPRASPFRDRADDASGCPLRARTCALRRARPRPGRRLCCPARALRARRSPTARAAHRGLAMGRAPGHTRCLSRPGGPRRIRQEPSGVRARGRVQSRRSEADSSSALSRTRRHGGRSRYRPRLSPQHGCR